MNSKKVFIIAEAGVNHNGCIETAKRLIKVASEAGADAIKFQTFKAENIVTKKAKKAQYQINNESGTDSQYEMLKQLEIDHRAHRELIAFCQQHDIMFLSTPFDIESINLLHELGIEIFKIPSGEITNLPYLRSIGSLKKEIILSTGMSNLNEIGEALEVLVNAGTPKEKVTILHANTEYPTPMEDVNLRAMNTIAETFDVKVGYSDHTLGVEVDIAAVALGANVIEKHITLDKTMPGPDHKASLEPDELEVMVRGIRNIEQALGCRTKKPSNSETKNLQIVRKSIIAKTEISEGELLTESNVTVKRPGMGISPMKWDAIIGSKAKRDYQEDELI